MNILILSWLVIPSDCCVDPSPSLLLRKLLHEPLREPLRELSFFQRGAPLKFEAFGGYCRL